jgi:hypothetical protein
MPKTLQPRANASNWSSLRRRVYDVRLLRSRVDPNKHEHRELWIEEFAQFCQINALMLSIVVINNQCAQETMFFGVKSALGYRCWLKFHIVVFKNQLNMAKYKNKIKSCP